MTRKHCVICYKPITEHFYVCMHCIKEFSIPYKYKEWPRWLKDLVNLEIKNLALLRLEEQQVSFGGTIESDDENCTIPHYELKMIKSF